MNCINEEKDMTPKDESSRSEGVQHTTGEEQTRTTKSPRKKQLGQSRNDTQKGILFNEQCIKLQENNRMGETRDLFNKSTKYSTWVQLQK